MTTIPHSIAGLSPRDAVTDAIYRACRGIDTNDKALFDSAFTSDAHFEIAGREPATSLAAMHTMFETVFKLDTTHFLSNVRVNVAESGTEAALTCSAQAYHFRTGTGVLGQQSFDSGALYELEAVRDEIDGGLWRLRRWYIKITWLRGDASIMQG